WTYITSTTGRTWMRIFDFGNGEGLDNIFFGRQDASSTLLFDVFPGQIVSDEDGIVTGEWRHLTTTISASDEGTSVNATHLYEVADRTPRPRFPGPPRLLIAARRSPAPSCSVIPRAAASHQLPVPVAW